MENYLQINGRKIVLTDEQSAALAEQFLAPSVQLSAIQPAETFWLAGREFVVLEQIDGMAAVILKGLLRDGVAFGNNNRYDGSDVDAACNEFAKEVEAAVGQEALIVHEVDLTADDGLKCYGSVQRKASLLTADQYRKYVDVLDTCKPEKWWWLATPYSTPKHEDDRWVKCVAPSGFIGSVFYYRGNRGFRPFCILKSDIFVSR